MVHESQTLASRGGSAEIRWALFAAVVGGLVLALAAWIRPLWYDETFTYYVSRLGSPAAVAEALMAGADNGPPVDYWLRHWSLALFGDTSLALRLPSVLAYLVTTWAVASIARARFGAAAAWAGVVALSLTVAPIYAVEARSYATLLMCMALALWAWQRAVDGTASWRYVAVLFASLFVSPLIHYYGALNYLPIIAAEMVVLRRAPGGGRRRVAVLSSLSSLAFVPPFARHAWEMKQHFWAAARNPWSVVDAFSSLVGICALLLILLVVLWFSNRPKEDRRPLAASTRGLLAAGLVLLLMPAVVYLAATVFTNAMAHRYALITTLGLALLASWLAAPIEKFYPRASRSVVAALLVFALAFNVDRLLIPATPPEVDFEGFREFLHTSSGDVVVENPQTFLHLYHGLDHADGRRLLYLSDAELSVKYLGYDTDEIALPKLRPYARFHLEGFESYLQSASEFLIVVTESRSWGSRELERRHYELDLVARLGGWAIYRATPPRSAR